MDFNSFKESLHYNQPPENISVYLQALWHEERGNWQRAHELVQDLDDERAARIHGYLHRKEGDSWNAGYWYRRAGMKNVTVSLAEEWEQIVNDLLKK